MATVVSSVDGVVVAYGQQGVGDPALIFVHGLVGDRSDFESQVSFFGGSHQVVAVDLPGSGESGRNRTDWTMAAFGEDVAAVADHLGLDDVVLVGHSLGGDVIVEAAKRLDGRVSALVWVSSYRSLGDPKSEDEIETWLAPFRTDFEAAMDDLTRRNFGPDADPTLVDAMAATARSADPGRVMEVLVSKLGNEPALLEVLAALSVPVIAVNPDFKPSDGDSFAAHGVELKVIPNVGHFTMIEDPEAFNQALTDILSDLATPP
jgi:pimeloyl-ACP methyl ester carboxylesterase